MTNSLNIEKAKKFMLGGNSTFTVSSKTTGQRYTFKASMLKAPKEGENVDRTLPIFVKVLTGSDNENSYSFLGTIWSDKMVYRTSPKSMFATDNKIQATFDWLFKTLVSTNQTNFDKIEFRHEGKCCVCGRKLTTPESIDSGIGPKCAKGY